MAEKEKKKGEKAKLEREYVVPLRKKWLKAPIYKRVPKAIKGLKEFIARHMKVENRDLRKVKLDKWLNVEMWFRGIKKPPAKIKVKAKKLENGNISVEIADIPEKLKWKMQKEKKLEVEAEKIKERRKKEEEAKKAAEQAKKEELKTEAKDDKVKKEKQEAVAESGQKQAEKQAKQIKHEIKLDKGPKHQVRKALKK